MSIKNSNKNIIPVLITPFKKNKIYEIGISNIYNFLKLNKISYVFAGGSYGSFATMSFEERIKFAYFTNKYSKENGIKVFFNISSSSLEEVKKIYEKIYKYNFFSLSILPPYYYSNTNFYGVDEISAFVNKIYDFTQHKNLCLYNNPKTTGIDLTPNDLFAIKSNTKINFIKDSNESFEKIIEISKFKKLVRDNKFYYIPGTTASMLMSGLLGFKYCMSGLFLSAPSLISNLYHSASSSNFREASEIYKKVFELRKIMGHYCPRAVSAYYVLNNKNIDVGEPNFPWPKLKTGDKKNLLSSLKKIGVK